MREELGDEGGSNGEERKGLNGCERTGNSSLF